MRRVRVDAHVRGETTYFGQCVHDWQPSPSGRGQFCVCGASCQRDSAGEIALFDAGVAEDEAACERDRAARDRRVGAKK